MERRRAGAGPALCECRAGRGGRRACAQSGLGRARVEVGAARRPDAAALQGVQGFLRRPRVLGLGDGGGLGVPTRRQQ